MKRLYLVILVLLGAALSVVVAKEWSQRARQPEPRETRGAQPTSRLNPDRGWRLVGTVLQANGAPAVAAGVMMTNGASWVCTKTDDKGRFAAQVAQATTYRISAADDQGWVGAGSVTVDRVENRSPDLVLSAHTSLTLDIVDAATDRAIPHAAARLVECSAGWRSDASGSIRLKGLPIGRWHVEVTAPGFGRRLIEVDIVRDLEETRIVDLRRGIEVRGVVRRKDGSPLTHATVVAERICSLSPCDTFETRTEGDQGWSLVIPEGVYRFGAHSGRWRGHASPVVVSGTATTPIEIVVNHSVRTIRGFVIGLDGEAAATVRLDCPFDSAGFQFRTVDAQDDGAFEFDVQDSQPCWLRASNSHASSPVVEVVGAGDAPVRLELLFRHEVNGIVIGPDGERVSGATVTFFPLASPPGVSSQGAEAAKGTLSDSHGEFTIRGVQPGPCTVAADAQIDGRFHVGHVRVSVPTEVVPVPLTATATIRGRVTFPDGSVPSRYNVGVDVAGHQFKDATGAFTLAGVRLGRHRIVVTGDDLLSTFSDFHPIQGDINVGTIIVEAAPMIRGIVAFPDGKPATGAIVTAGWAVGDESGFLSRGMGMKTATTDADGRFVLAADSSEDVPIRAQLGVDWVSSVVGVDVASGRIANGVRLTMQRTARLAGAVQSEHGPIPARVIAVRAGDGETLVARTDHAGRFVFAALREGQYEIRAEPLVTGLSRVSKMVNVQADAENVVDLTASIGPRVLIHATLGARCDLRPSFALLPGGSPDPENQALNSENDPEEVVQVTRNAQGELVATIAIDGIQPGAYSACALLYPQSMASNAQAHVKCHAVPVDTAGAEVAIDMSDHCAP